MAIVDEPGSQNKQEQAPPPASATPIKVFISYAHRDEDFRLELNDHLANLQRQGLIAGWHDRQIVPGQEWANQIDQALNEARIILLLVSARFLASDYCHDKEMGRAIERHNAKEAVVIPIILSACDWQGTPFSKLQALPKDAKPIKSWADRDEAWLDVVRGLRKVIDSLHRSIPTTEALDALGKQLALDLMQSGGALPASTLHLVREKLEAEKHRHGQSGDAPIRREHLENVMHEINFTRLRAFLRHVEQHYAQAGFAALCVVQQNEAMGGYWGLKCIQAWLKTAGIQPKEIEIQPIGEVAIDAMAIARRLVSVFEVDSGELLLKGVSALTKKICSSLHSYCGILITVQSFGEFTEDTWHWLLQEFWCSLLKEFRQKQNLVCVRLVMVLQTDSPVDSNTIAAHSCDAEAATFDQAKLARLPLDHWTQEELLKWLTDYWGENRTDADLKALARNIFRASNQGQPPFVYSQCIKQLVREAG